MLGGHTTKKYASKDFIKSVQGVFMTKSTYEQLAPLRANLFRVKISHHTFLSEFSSFAQNPSPLYQCLSEFFKIHPLASDIPWAFLDIVNIKGRGATLTPWHMVEMAPTETVAFLISLGEGC